MYVHVHVLYKVCPVFIQTQVSSDRVTKMQKREMVALPQSVFLGAFSQW